MKEEISYKEAIVTKINLDRINVEKQLAILKVFSLTIAIAIALKTSIYKKVLNYKVLYNCHFSK